MMKNRRLTILCVAMVALAGTPRAWQEAGKLLAVIQHKAQVKFWSMVMQPKTRESAGSELMAAARPSSLSPASFDSACPLNSAAPQAARASVNSRAGRRANASTPAQPVANSRARDNAEAAIGPASHAGLVASAYKAWRDSGRDEELRRAERIRESVSSRIAASTRPAPPAVPADVVASALPHPAPAHTGKAENFRFVMMPTLSPVASALIDKESIVQLKMIRKTLEDSKLTRQKSRLPASRGGASIPSI